MRERIPGYESVQDRIDDLIAPPPTKRKRNCLRCGKKFVSAHFGNCICGACNERNSRMPSSFEYL